MELGDRLLVVQLASSSAGGNAGGMRPGSGANAIGPGGGAGGMGPVPAFAQQSGPITSRAIVMLNMVTPEELAIDDDYEDILLDIKEECSKYGEVEELRIPRPAKKVRKVAGQLAQAEASAAEGQKSDEDAGVGRVFVLFRTIEGARAGVQAIAGRQFGGRVIICAALDEAEFMQKRIGDTDVEPAASGEAAPPAAPGSPPRNYDE
jgi:splicing factor U2AF subunit